MNSIFYLVVKRGIFAQYLVGLFASRDAAAEVLATEQAKESDNHHEFDIIELEVGKVLTTSTLL